MYKQLSSFEPFFVVYREVDNTLFSLSKSDKENKEQAAVYFREIGHIENTRAQRL